MDGFPAMRLFSYCNNSFENIFCISIAPPEIAIVSAMKSPAVFPAIMAKGMATQMERQKKQSMSEPARLFPSHFLILKITSHGPSSAWIRWVIRHVASVSITNWNGCIILTLSGKIPEGPVQEPPIDQSLLSSYPRYQSGYYNRKQSSGLYRY